MAGYNSEDEQVEALKRWWNKNGVSTILAIVILLGGWFGWQTWQARQLQAAEAASIQYQSLLMLVSQIEQQPSAEAYARADTMVGQLKEAHEGSIYTAYSALLLARLKVEQGEVGQAIAELEWVLQAPSAENLKQLASIRLARLHYANGEADRALALVEQAVTGEFAVSAGELKGDILLTKGDMEGARAAYQQALAVAAKEESSQPFIQMKLESLPSQATATDGE